MFIPDKYKEEIYIIEMGRWEKGEGRREKGEGRREKGEGRREKSKLIFHVNKLNENHIYLLKSINNYAQKKSIINATIKFFSRNYKIYKVTP